MSPERLGEMIMYSGEVAEVEELQDKQHTQRKTFGHTHF